MMTSGSTVPSSRYSSIQVAALFVLRLVIGWHFLYEGLVKVLDPEWTSAGYLLESHWVLSGFFHWIVAHPQVLRIVDLLNAYGLVAIGSALFLGLLTRWACAFGILLLLLYYLANPAIPGHMSEIGTEGHYLLVNKNVVEMIALALLLFFPGSSDWGLGRLFRRRRTLRSDTAPGASALANAEPPSEAELAFLAQGRRRDLLAGLAVIPFIGAFAVSFWRAARRESFEEKQLMAALGSPYAATTSATRQSALLGSVKYRQGDVPHGRIGPVQISRLICGGNLISGIAHARDLIYVSPLLRQYFTDDKVISTLRLCESCGINTAILRTDANTIRILQKYWNRGGKIQWLAQVYPKEDDLTSNTQWALDNGAVGAYIQGNIADRWVKAQRIDLFERVISFVRSRGKIAGTGAHQLEVPMALEAAKIDLDFYMKTLHRDDYWSLQTEDQFVDVSDNKHDNYWCLDPQRTVEFMQTVNTPWIAYKVLAAGAIKPEVGFRHAFENGADFACVGMFDFQVVPDVNTLVGLWPEVQKRKRPWLA